MLTWNPTSQSIQIEPELASFNVEFVLDVACYAALAVSRTVKPILPLPNCSTLGSTVSRCAIAHNADYVIGRNSPKSTFLAANRFRSIFRPPASSRGAATHGATRRTA